MRAETEVARDVRELLDTATRIDLERDLKGDELITARERYPGLGEQSALAEYLTATNLLLERYRRSREVHPGGAAVVRAAVDWERCGVTRRIASEDLLFLASRKLTALRANLAFTDRSFEEAIAWACEPVVSTAALLTVTEHGYDAFDYVVDWVSDNEDPVDDATWARVAAELSEIEGLGIGLAAYKAGRYDLARQAWEAAARHEPTAAVTLGVLRAEQGDAAGAAAALQLAIDSGHADASPMAAVNLKVLRKEQGHSS